MTLAEALRSHAVVDPSLSTLIGNRFYLGQRFQGGALPAVCVRRIGGERPVAQAPANVSLMESMLQFDVFGVSLTQCRAVESALRSMLETFPGSTGYRASRFHFISPGLEDYLTEPAALYRLVITASCWHNDD